MWFIAGLVFKMWLDILPWTLHSFEHNIQFTHVLALCDPFGVDVPLNFDITRLGMYTLNKIRIL